MRTYQAYLDIKFFFKILYYIVKVIKNSGFFLLGVRKATLSLIRTNIPGVHISASITASLLSIRGGIIKDLARLLYIVLCEPII